MPLISITHTGPLVAVTLNRPEVRNAFNEQLVAELTAWASGPMPAGARVAILKGAGPVFCAGADLAWMSTMVGYSREENVRDALALAAMFDALDRLPLPLIGRVQGAAVAGGAGLAAVCDIVVAAENAIFGFTEAKVGIVPSVIAPFALQKIGVSASRELFLTGARFTATRAREIGLVHTIASEAGLDGAVEAYVHELSSSAPGAVAAAKQLIREIAFKPVPEVVALTADTIADRRVSSEGQAGMRAFLQKVRAPWVVD